MYRAFLRYLYTDEVNLPETEALELLDLANSSGENILKVRLVNLFPEDVGFSSTNAVRNSASHRIPWNIFRFLFS